MERGFLSRTSGEAVRMLLWASVVCLSMLPHIQTANELMTNIALRTGAYSLIERFMVPSMTRMVVPERLTWLLLPLTIIHPVFVGRRRRNNGNRSVSR